MNATRVDVLAGEGSLKHYTCEFEQTSIAAAYDHSNRDDLHGDDTCHFGHWLIHRTLFLELDHYRRYGRGAAGHRCLDFDHRTYGGLVVPRPDSSS